MQKTLQNSLVFIFLEFQCAKMRNLKFELPMVCLFLQFSVENYVDFYWTKDNLSDENYTDYTFVSKLQAQHLRLSEVASMNALNLYKI